MKIGKPKLFDDLRNALNLINLLHYLENVNKTRRNRKTTNAATQQ